MNSRKRDKMGTTGTKQAPETPKETVQPVVASVEPADIDKPLYSKEQQIKAVKIALESPNYNWRTINGISTETGLDDQTISEVLSKDLPDILIRSRAPDEKGQILYTTREHYKKKQSTLNRILSAVSGVVK